MQPKSRRLAEHSNVTKTGENDDDDPGDVTAAGRLVTNGLDAGPPTLVNKEGTAGTGGEMNDAKPKKKAKKKKKGGDMRFPVPLIQLRRCSR